MSSELDLTKVGVLSSECNGGRKSCRLGKFGLDMDIAEEIKNLYK